MVRRSGRLVLASALLCGPGVQGADPLEEGFRDPPAAARPAIYYLLLNGYVNREHVPRELEEYRKAGIGGLCLFDMGARGDPSAQPPAGPAFLGAESVRNFGDIIRTAGRLGMEVDLSVASSWDMGGSWVEPRDASMTLVHSRLEIEGPREAGLRLPFPEVPAETPKGADGRPGFHREIAVLAIPNARPVPAHEFLLELERPWPREIGRVVLHNTLSGEAENFFAKDFTVSVSESSEERSAFREAVRGALEPRQGAQEFRFPAARARYVLLEIRSGHNPRGGPVQLGEFEVWTAGGRNVALSHAARRQADGAELLRYTSERGRLGAWSAARIHDGIPDGARGSWSSAGVPPLVVEDSRAVADLTGMLGADGTLRWKAPPGRWTILRYVCVNTGERLKVPSPNSDGLATDHFNAEATTRFIREVIARLRPGTGDFRRSALRDLYLASYEVRGQVWTPGFLEEFRRRRGYDLTRFLPVLSGGRVDGEETTGRVRYDFRKTQGELLVDAYYRAASRAAHEAGLGIESEAGGPGPPIHQVPVDALAALGAVDEVRGEFWPYRPEARALWVVKETAAAAHIYGKRRVQMEAFTSSRHWEEGPIDLKPSADRAFCEGMNRVVWHTASHQPPESGRPGWVYNAGTHLTPNVPWWPMAKPFLDYLARASFLLQQGLFVADVLYYYGDQGYNFVPPKETDPSLGPGYDYDVTNADVILRRLNVRDGRLVLPDGMSYEVLALPDRPGIDLAVLRRIGDLVAGGATVVGRKPERSTGYAGYPERDGEVRALAERIWGPCDGRTVREHDHGKGKVICGRSLRDVLAGRGVEPDFSYEDPAGGADLDFIHRRDGETDIYFVRNRLRRWAEVEAAFRVGAKRPELWDPADGGRRDAPAYEIRAAGVRLPLRLAPEGSAFVVFREPAGSGREAAVPPAAAPETVEMAGPWIVRFPPDSGAPETATFDRLASWTDHADSGIRFFSGVAEYRREIHIPPEWLRAGRRVALELGGLWAVAEVALNGRPAGVAWKEPFEVDLTAAARPGPNELLVRVANNWMNRLAGDARTPGGPRYTRTNVTGTGVPALPWSKIEPRRSGLLGPVRLRADGSR